MLFNSLEFLFLFLPVVIGSYYLLPTQRLRILFLVVSSYFFYGFWNYKFIPLLLISTFLDFKIAQYIHTTKELKIKKALLLLSICTNLGLLGFFKYFNFFIENAISVLQLVGIQSAQLNLNIILPVGISFYTFQSMSYTIDIYRDKSKPYTSLATFAAYIALFPQLIAGPIVRHSDLMPQMLNTYIKKFDMRLFNQGIFFFVCGLAKKIIIADRIALAVDQGVSLLPTLSAFEAWLCAIGYTMQLYFDFSGYSDMAIGLGALLGFKFPFNFNSPYKSKSITEFWQRWHMTLSFWLRDYLYISLGGNRKGAIITYRNLILTMLLGGLWHGAGWTFVLWGFFHGSILAIERFLKQKQFTLPINNLIKHILSLMAITFGWVVFRSKSVNEALLWYSKMFYNESLFTISNFSPSVKDRFLVILAMSLLICFKSKNTQQIASKMNFSNQWAFYLAFTFFLSVIYLSKESPFLYFQF